MAGLNALTIKVNRFGPLEDVSFELAPLMIFTGMSSTGKSYANYLVYYYMSSALNTRLSDVLDNMVDSKQVYQRTVFRLDAFLESLRNGAQGFMQKFLGDDTITCDVEFKSRLKKRELDLEIERITDTNKEPILPSRKDKDRFRIVANGKARELNTDATSLPYHISFIIADFILGESYFRSVIFPPGRGAFVGENYSMKTDVSSSLGMYNAFFKDYDYGLWENGNDYSDGLSGILLEMTSGGRLLSVDSKQYLQLDENTRIALSASASSVKDMSPLLFFLKNHLLWLYSFCLEEPEAHQHPSVTLKIADVIAIMLNKGNIFHLTTHSDYLIQRLNQLIKMGSIRKRDLNVFHKICQERKLDELCYVNSDSVKAYFFTKDVKSGKTIVEKLKVDDNGIPMKSFFDVVRDLNEREDYINDALYRLN